MDTLFRAKPYIPPESKEWILDKFDDILTTGGLIQGKYVAEFEEKIKELVKVENAIATTSCGTGLETVLMASGIKGKKFIVPTQTFAASVNCIIRSGNIPLIVDVDSKTQCLSKEIILQNMDEEVAGIVLVNMAGLITPEMLSIEEYCDDNGLFLLTDDAHSLGASYYDVYMDHIRFAGSFGDAGVFSFYPSKIITTAEGGMITTNNDKLAEKCRVIRNHGTVRNEMLVKGLDFGVTCEIPSTNYRMTEFCAVLGLSQLKYLGTFLEKRNTIADEYKRELKDIDWLDTAPTYTFIQQSWWQYIVKINDGRARTTLLKKLLDEYKIPTANAYWPLCHQQSIYKDYLSPHGYKNSEELIMKVFSLPMYYELAITQVYEICEALREM